MYWVVIEAGAKQAYIFRTNKRRATVGASQLVHEVGLKWVDDACAECRTHAHFREVDIVVQDSGKANLLVQSAEQGRCLVGAVTRKALDLAPGLEVWGAVVECGDDPDLKSLAAAQAEHAQARGRRPTHLLRSPMLPVVRPCPFTGGPAQVLLEDRILGEDANAPRSEWVSAQFHGAVRAGERLEKPADQGQTPASTPTGRGVEMGAMTASHWRLSDFVVPGALARTDQEFEGWVGVLHADGDGVGALFSAINRYGSRATLTDASAALRTVTRNALVQAIAEVDAARPTGEPAGWVLPLIVGGDDVTLLIEGRWALALAIAFCREFDAKVGDSKELQAALAEMRTRQADASGGRPIDYPVPDVISASAGVAIVKPHYPFADAAHLAEELCRSAKKLGGESSLDVHVLFDSVHTALSALRAPLRKGLEGAELRLWGGPYRVAACQDSGCNGSCGSVDHLTEARDAMSKQAGTGVVGGTAAHRIRSALTALPPIHSEPATEGSWVHPSAQLDIVLEQVLLRTDSRSARDAVKRHAIPIGESTRWLDALALRDVAEGVIDA